MAYNYGLPETPKFYESPTFKLGMETKTPKITPKIGGGFDWSSLLTFGVPIAEIIGGQYENREEEQTALMNLAEQLRKRKRLKAIQKPIEELTHKRTMEELGRRGEALPETLTRAGFDPTEILAAKAGVGAPKLAAEPYRVLEESIGDYLTRKRAKEEAETVEEEALRKQVEAAKKKFAETPWWEQPVFGLGELAWNREKWTEDIFRDVI